MSNTAHRWRMSLSSHPRPEGPFQAWWSLVDMDSDRTVNALEVELEVPCSTTIPIVEGGRKGRGYLEFTGEIDAVGDVVKHEQAQVTVHEKIIVRAPAPARGLRHRSGSG